MRAPVLSIAMLMALMMTGAAVSADLVIGRATEQSSLDPLFARSGTNYSTSGQIFERLVMNDANNQLGNQAARQGQVSRWH
jgi:peptide/nickel transport system substrate-binding protein